MKAQLALVAKAVAGGVVAGLGAAVTAAADESITAGEWWAIAAAAAAAAYAVWQTPNAAAPDLEDYAP